MALLLIILICCSLRVFAQSDSCSFKEGGYSLAWRYDADTQMVVFDLSATAPEGSQDFWTGVGFGQGMADMDFIGVFVRNGQIGVADTFTTGHAQPTPDPVANVQILSFDYSAGRVTAEFARPLDTGDEKDKSLSGCQTFQFPVSGGLIEGTGLAKHLVTPKNAEVCNIVSQCAGGGNGTAGGAVSGAALPLDQNATTTTPINSFTDASVNVSNQVSTANETGNGLPPDGSSTNVLPGGPQIATGGANTSASGDSDQCSFTSGNYAISWSFDPATNNINFKLSTLVDKPKFWSGIGIGPNMSNLDVLLVFVEDNVVASMADLKATRHGEPVLDAQQDIVYNNDGKVIDGKVQVSFSRPLTTTDEIGDLAIDGDGCNTFQFPVSGGAFLGTNRPRKHDITPIGKEVCGIKTHCVAGQASVGGLEQPTQSSSSPNTSNDSGNGTSGSGGEGLPTVSGASGGSVTATPTLSGGVTSTPTGDLTPTPSAGEAQGTNESVALQPSGAQGTNESVPLQSGGGSSSSTVSAPLVCNPDQNDLTVCAPYFDEYFGRVDEWAKLHSVAPDSQYWKACKLIGAVANVKTLCCNIFSTRCKQYES